MNSVTSLADIRKLEESWSVECKLAQGKDGDGALPEDIWETYSAFANTRGGDIFLGLRELAEGEFELAGIENPEKVIDEFLAGLNNPAKVNINHLCVDSIVVFEIDGKNIIHIHVPKLPHELGPVYIGNDPLTGSYMRTGDQDVRQSPDKVRKMLAKLNSQALSKA